MNRLPPESRMRWRRRFPTKPASKCSTAVRFDLLLREGSLSALSQDATRRTRLGHLLALDYFVNLRRAAKDNASPWVIEAVNAQTGVLAGSVTVPAAPGAGVGTGQPPGSCKDALLGKTVAKPDSVGFRRIAVLDFGVAEDVRERQRSRRRPASERGDAPEASANTATCSSSTAVFCQQVAREHRLSANSGLTDYAGQTRLPMLGADFIVTGEVRTRARQESRSNSR